MSCEKLRGLNSAASRDRAVEESPSKRATGKFAHCQLQSVSPLYSDDLSCCGGIGAYAPFPFFLLGVAGWMILRLSY